MYTPQERKLDRRAFPRQPVQMDAYINSARLGRREVEIRDFCLGGLFLVPRDSQAAYIQFRGHTGETITVHLSCPTPAGHKDFSLNVRMARVSEGGIGVAFSKPGPEVLQVLHYLTAQSRRVPPKPTPALKRTVHPDERKGKQGDNALIKACQQQIIDFSPIILRDFFERLDEALFLCARDAENNLEQTFYLDAIEEIKGHRPQVEEHWQKKILARLSALGTTGNAPLPPREDKTESSKLSMVDKDEFEDWLAIAEAVSKMEARYADPLFELEKRFSRLAGESLDKENNPVGPRAICRALQEAIRDLEISHYIKQRIYKVFKETAEDKLSLLYNNLNELLRGEGILPSLERKFAAPQRQSTLKKALPFSEESSVQANGAASSSMPDKQEEAPLSNPVSPASISPSSVLKPETHAFDRPQQADSTIATAEAYRVTRELLGLYKLGGRRPRGGEEPSGKAAASSLKANKAFANSSMTSVSEDRIAKRMAHLLPEIMEQEGTVHNDRSSAEACELMEITGNLLVSILEDSVLSENTKSWIEQLEAPLLRLAVLDKAFLHLEDHPARQLLNLLAQLEIPPSEERDDIDAQLEDNIDYLVEYIARDFDQDVAIFNRVLDELKHLLEQRTQSISSNIAQVVESYKAQQELKKKRRRIAEKQLEAGLGGAGDSRWGDPMPSVKNREEDPEEWVNRAKQLPLHCWVQFADGQNHLRRLQLVWVAEDCTTFVFVDSKGRKAATLSLNEVAMQLRRGTATVLEDANVPLLDRAQYAVLQKFHSHIAYEATHDPLTGLVNRKEFEQQANRALAKADHEAQSYVLLYLDLDQFKIINSTCGYEAGDALLKEIASLLTEFLPDGGILARLGDNQFGVLLNQCSHDEGCEIAEQQRIAIDNHRLVWNNKRLSVGASIGLVSVSEQKCDAAVLLQRAEAACMEAKEAGRNRIQACEFDDEEFRRRHGMIEWVARIDEVLEDGRLQLWCQRITPIADHLEMEPHYEILLRLRDQDGRWIAAGEFIQTAEFYHRMAAIDQWVIQSAFRWMADHKERLEQLGGIAINLSGQSLNDRRLVTFIKREFARTGVPPQRVCFEITETAGVANLSHSAQLIEAVKDLGCHFSLDDFGSGLSSYSYLKNLPVDYLKIDGAFVKDIATSPSDYAVVKSINEIGHFMGKKVIAEFVESKAILAKLQEIGVDFAQGYGIEPPQILSAIE
ncbi:diguanylate cyclase/phosphodiesterase [Nitrosococcus oceani ATCC 19707]|uniref:Diguanylate cyclase/phosphodiesterase n=2 Tax=Nitrosococcus oceani TaxID=1229 RepID=Q3J907_NITOC|nr:DUF1631 family protein [Nitrosococcus oceani]ABA58689.1 diguanylate cyclase/phosphodiesterase [Nitrosococcus oceani ATCC 19707]EDZ67921.1 conserved hypothetical protein [Nitrosococcus oceani AFC27]KFI18872.1 diguanylate phosphodiesterase [Nitrosococcus oceani C-27]GEM19222.1 diguanylate phosphodiesterase [Nitrosococcus oceani]